MACRLFVAEASFKPMLEYGQLDTQWHFNRNSYISIQENAFETVVWKMSAICLGLNDLTCWCLMMLTGISEQGNVTKYQIFALAVYYNVWLIVLYSKKWNEIWKTLWCPRFLSLYQAMFLVNISLLFLSQSRSLSLYNGSFLVIFLLFLLRSLSISLYAWSFLAICMLFLLHSR